jgi:hypothetical protein
MDDRLKEAAHRRHEEALCRARAALRRVSGSPEPVTFASVARAGNVSTDFLYRTPELRTVIEQLRTRSTPTQSTPTQTGALRALAATLRHERATHQQRLKDLTAALEHAHGENLELRRRLARYE